MLHRLTINAAGLAAYVEVMASDPCGYLGDGTANACMRLASTLHRISHLADVANTWLSRVRRALVAPFKSLRVEAA